MKSWILTRFVVYAGPDQTTRFPAGTVFCEVGSVDPDIVTLFDPASGVYTLLNRPFFDAAVYRQTSAFVQL